MPDLQELCRIAEFRLAPADAGTAAERAVRRVRVRVGAEVSTPARAEEASEGPGALTDTLVVADGGGPARALTALLAELAERQAAGLALHVPRHGAAAVPGTVRSAAGRLGVPLLTTTASLAEWARLAPRLADLVGREDRRRAGDLAALLDRLPTRPSDPDALLGVAEWLSQALPGGQVMVSDPLRGVLAASPATAPTALAPLLVQQAVGGVAVGSGPLRGVPAAAGSSARLHTRIIQLAPTGATLSAASCEAFGERSRELMRRAAQVLGLIAQCVEDRAERAGPAGRTALNAARLAAFQLLMVGDAGAAERVMAGISPGLLSREEAYCYVVECGGTDREETAGPIERAVDDRAMLVRCPAFDHHLIVVHPCASEPEDRRLREALAEIVRARPGHRLGGSRPGPLGELAAAYTSAVTALVLARRAPDRVVFADEQPRLIDVLDPEPARRWAGTLLRPLLRQPTGRRGRLLDTLALGLEFRAAPAAAIIGCHRNTLDARLRTAFNLLGLDRNSDSARVRVSLAVQIAGQWGYDESDTDPEADFRAMLSGPAVRQWAAGVLEPLAPGPGDGRDLRRTVRAWVTEADCNAERAAEALGVSTATVRRHLAAVGPLLQRELYIPGGQEDLDLAAIDPRQEDETLSGLRPLWFAVQALATEQPSSGHG
ncbi:helix-turn-helix domain-containing protein [Phaeacidiphilus oryzae]|uniref:helix-turn-helix domain-containing protein n=1 Tax=Phaeacidiphilus oryzae TaxID=348818 RepID=UPI0006924D33|nr:helix-turn-helix domain-containing protein [Phaeacidiphilus oryzae]